MRVHVVLFTSDLRVHDHPPLRAALTAGDVVVPLFVRDTGVAGFLAPNREAFLADCLRDLDAALRDRGGRLVVRSGDVVDEVAKVVTETDACVVHVAGGVSAYAHRREDRLRDTLHRLGCDLVAHDGVVTCVPPGAVTPDARDHFAVFTPYHRHWAQHGLRAVVRAPRAVRVPDGVGGEVLPERADVSGVSPGLAEGGERAGRALLTSWLRSGIAAYEDRHDDLAGDATSRLSPHLHFGTISSVEAVHRANTAGGPGAEAFVRQLAWRDFHHQVLAARPDAAHADYRTHHDRWRRAPREVEAWQEGRTGYPVVDAAMRQLRHEGWMHNRGRIAHGVVPRQDAVRGLAGGRAPFPEPVGGRGRREQPDELAVDGGHRHGQPTEPGAQSGDPGQALRPGRRLRTALGTGVGGRRGLRGAHAVEGGKPRPGRPRRLSGPDRRAAGRPCPVQAGPGTRLISG